MQFSVLKLDARVDNCLLKEKDQVIFAWSIPKLYIKSKTSYDSK